MDRRGDFGDVHPGFKRCRTHANLHSCGDRISGARSSATSAATVPIVAASPGSPAVAASGSVQFTALHTYYMSPTGSDSNSGLTAATAWATPNHASTAAMSSSPQRGLMFLKRISAE